MMFTGMISGPIQAALGHANFFKVVLVASIPPVLFAAFAPFEIREEKNDGPAVPAGH
jgi:hypothetical protein